MSYVGYNDQGGRYYLAASLVALFREIDALWPQRDRGTDGWIGDASHQARESDHNPDWSAGGVVRADDIDKDGIDVPELLDALTGDARVEYVIHNRRMMRSYAKTIDGHTYKPWEWAPYYGDNPHTGHVHVSIKHTRSAETDTAAWFKAAQPEDDMANADDILAEIQAFRTEERARYNTETDRWKAEADRWAVEAKRFAALFARNVDPQELAAAVVAKLPAGAVDQATVEAGVRAVLLDAATE
ncbi:hypothetical protein [Kribbella sp. NBC_00889]|uniref:hypothetical protein n=1 Tax=Kribbella sp. NBC_00889 TaxID=2975974 RepID=UPI00386FEDF0|nr:hypothetical protein OG817_22180 [Kribbella sp. NBC_00889]